MKELIVSPKHDGKKLDIVLQDHFDGLTYVSFCKALRKRDIRVNQIRIHENVVVHSGDHIKIFLVDEELFQKHSIQIVYEDSNICIVNKPSGIEVTGEHSLTVQLQKYLQNKHVSPCHRLDRNTCGLVLYAKNETALCTLLEKMKKHEIEKHYLAVVCGIPKEKQNTLTAYLFKDKKKAMVYLSNIPKKGYVPIMTSYQIVQKNTEQNISLLDVTLHTGKTHQIRAHLAHIGLPILGDRKIWKQ